MSESPKTKFQEELASEMEKLDPNVAFAVVAVGVLETITQAEWNTLEKAQENREYLVRLLEKAPADLRITAMLASMALAADKANLE